MNQIDRSPAVISTFAAIGLATLVFVAIAPVSVIALVLGGLGVALVAAGLFRADRAVVSGGGCALFLGTVAGGVTGSPVLVTLVGLVASVLAWDSSHRAIDLGAQLGREAATDRLELVALAMNASVGILTGGIGYLVYLLGAGGQPLSAVFFGLLAVLALFATLRRAPVPAGE